VNLLSVGRLSYEKGLDHLIICLRRLGSASYKLTLCGDGPYRQRLQSLVNAQGLDDHVHFLGRIPWGQRLSEVYARSDILVLPSLSEGSPKVLLEAMAKGLPVIATRVGGIPDIIEDMENGILVPPGDSQALANAIEMIARNNVLRNKIIENGYRFAKEHTAKKQAHRITEIMRSCAGGSH
jgi:glycosyltransferase involved in cell wall biosynthesis